MKDNICGGGKKIHHQLSTSKQHPTSPLSSPLLCKVDKHRSSLGTFPISVMMEARPSHEPTAADFHIAKDPGTNCMGRPLYESTNEGISAMVYS